MQVPRPRPCFWQKYSLPSPVQTFQQSSLPDQRSWTRVGQVTQVLQVRGGSRRPRLRLHGSVAGVVSRAPRTGCLRTHRSLREARDYPEGEAELPETGGEEKGRRN